MSTERSYLLPGEFIFEDTAFPRELAIENVGFVCGSETDTSNLRPGKDLEARLSLHVRSSIFWRAGGDTQPVQDQYGNEYRIGTIKGAVLDEPHIEDSSYETDGMRIFGLQHPHDALQSILKSTLLRSLGISTEWVFAAFHPTAYPSPQKSTHASAPLLSVRTFMEGLPAYKTMGKALFESPEEMQQVASQIEPMVTFRLMRSGLRLADFSKLYEYNRYSFPQNELDMVFSDICQLLHALGEGALDYTLSDADKKWHIGKYFTALFPAMLGRTVKAFHRHGLAHNYLHGGNVTLHGEIVDTESITGNLPWLTKNESDYTHIAQKGDVQRFRRDFVDALSSLEHIVGHLWISKAVSVFDEAYKEN